MRLLLELGAMEGCQRLNKDASVEKTKGKKR